MALNKVNIVGSGVGTLKDVEEAFGFTSRGLVTVGLQPRILHSQDDD
jgi:D-arabinose 1-dehydrogenase-like Zn-dependent alcohol dehydrogenase